MIRLIFQMLGGFLTVIAFVVIFGAVIMKLGEYVCEQSWRDSGMPYRYKMFSGCQVQPRDGVWIPASKYRETDE